jgi:hypothetical protein
VVVVAETVTGEAMKTTAILAVYAEINPNTFDADAVEDFRETDAAKQLLALIESQPGILAAWIEQQ